MFTPLCIYNNTEGDRDAASLAAYGERSWNNPVARVVDAERRDLTKALTRRWSVAGMTGLMVNGLAAAQREVPAWLQLLADTVDVSGASVETAIFGMS